jgi:murein DD-endopeptidase MepM/ murein hydrolase activator NlpD
VNGVKFISRYGKRQYPILSYTKINRGIDFAAPKGAQVMAAGDQTFEAIGPNGAYGNYIRIRHNSAYKTA